MSKNANGEGSIHKRKDGRWCASISVGLGKRRHFLGKTRPEVAAQLVAALSDRDKGILVTSPRQSVRKFFTAWLVAVQPSLRPRTHVRYEELVRLHVIPDIGSSTIASLTPQRLQRLYTVKLQELSPTTVNHLHAVIHKALSSAVKWGVASRNVADFVDPPRAAPRAVTTLTSDEARALLTAAAGSRLEALYVLAVTTGMRQGEILGLRWRDVDLDHGMVQIRGSMQALKGVGLHIAEPKTAGSRRHVMLSQRPIEALRRHRVGQAAERLRIGANWEDNDLVFANEVGRPIAAGNLLRRSFEPLLKRAGLPRIRFHDLRHTSATLLLGQGVHPKIVSEMLGHSKITTTLDLYSHVTPTMQREAVQAFDAILAAGDRP